MATAKKTEIFRTPVSEPKVTVTPSGEREEEVIAMKLDENGREEFYIAGKTNVWEKTQADLEESKIGVILKRVNETGDISILNMRQGMYADITNTPKNMIEINERYQKAEKEFKTLPKEIQKAYDYDYMKFYLDAGSENWNKLMGLSAEPATQPEKEETVNNEPEQ